MRLYNRPTYIHRSVFVFRGYPGVLPHPRLNQSSSPHDKYHKYEDWGTSEKTRAGEKFEIYKRRDKKWMKCTYRLLHVTHRHSLAGRPARCRSLVASRPRWISATHLATIWYGWALLPTASPTLCGILWHFSMGNGYFDNYTNAIQVGSHPFFTVID